MSAALGIKKEETSLRNTVRHYLRRAKDIESYLSKRPKEWGRFQAEFNAEINSVFRNIMEFEKISLAKNREDKVYKLKRLFINRIREMFLRGEYINWSLRKPFSYAGDFKIIDMIYLNDILTTGFERLFDNYFQMSSISVAVRNRKEDFKRMIVNFIKERNGQKLRIMDLACGPCREIKDILSEDGSLFKNIVLDCYENDSNAIEYAKALLAKHACEINFLKENAVRIALKKDIGCLIGERYDFIYSTGLFDYFEEKIAIRLIQNLRKLLKPDGVLAISDVRDKYSNPSIHFMEWVGDWNLVYRDDDSFREIFIEAGFKENELDFQYEQQGILQYIIASNKEG